MPTSKFVKYDASAQGGRATDPKVTFGTNGLISINRHAAKLLGLKATDKISFWQDPIEDTHWFIGKDKAGMKISPSGDSGGFHLSSSKTSKDFACAMLQEYGKKSLSCQIEESPKRIDDIEVFALFTRPLLPNHKTAGK